MELQPLTLIAPKIQVSEIFPALELIMSHQAISEAISFAASQAGRRNEQSRKAQSSASHSSNYRFSNSSQLMV